MRCLALAVVVAVAVETPHLERAGELLVVEAVVEVAAEVRPQDPAPPQWMASPHRQT